MANVSLVMNCIVDAGGPLDGLIRLRARLHSFRNSAKPELVAHRCDSTSCLYRSVGAS